METECFFYNGRLLWQGQISVDGEVRDVVYDLSKGAWERENAVKVADLIGPIFKQAIFDQSGKFKKKPTLPEPVKIER